VISALDLGQPVTLIGESVFARCLSALKEERVTASKILTGPVSKPAIGDRTAFIEDVRRALYCSKIISYAQGYMLLKTAAKENGWKLNMGGIALMWRGGCIIRSRFLAKIKDAFDKNPAIENLLLDSFFSGALNQYQASWRKAQIHALERTHTGVLHRAGVFRRLQGWAVASQSAAGTARLFRRPHL